MPIRPLRQTVSMVLLMAAAASMGGRIGGDRVPVIQAAPVQSSSDIYKSVYNGWKIWHVYCYRCHGMNAIASTLGPSLIEPNGQFSRAEFLKFVRTGDPDNGMPAWNKLLDDPQIIDVQTYIKARTDKVLPPGRPDEVGPNGGPWKPPAGWRRPS